MRTRFVAVAVLGGLLAACSADNPQQDSRQADAKSQRAPADNALATAIAMGRTHQGETFANLPDTGALLKYASAKPEAKGADTWHQVSLSETHALRAVTTGTMEVPAPDGTPIRLKYDRSIEHGDGNWTWVGRVEGGKAGSEAVITFGERAVFGTIPSTKGALQVTTLGGKGYVVQTDETKLAAVPESDADFLIPDISAAVAAKRTASAASVQTVGAAPTAEKAIPASIASTVDIVVGYTAGLAARLGSTSAAVTRIHQVVDLANTAYQNSQIDARLRLLTTVQVNYSDDTTNRSSLFELTGVTCTTSAAAANLPDTGASCTPGTRPASLVPIFNAREGFGADLAVLMRDHRTVHGSCGLGWMNGGGQTGLTAAHAAYGFSVVSDSATTATCRNETLAHETGHNMGLQHDLIAAAGTNGVVEPEEFGVFEYSFGHSEGADAGNFYTVMSVRRTGQIGELVFANQRVVRCGAGDAFPCGDAATGDNWRSLVQTLPIVASFRQALVPMAGTWARGDFNGDGQADIVWRNRGTGANALWRSANSATSQSLAAVNNLAWTIAGSADFDGDGAADLLWRNPATGQNAYWRSGNSATSVALATVPSPWMITGAGDFDGDGHDDLMWRHPPTGRNAIWRGGNNATPIAVSSVGGTAWVVAGIADFDADGRDDIFWRNTVSGANTIWRGGNSATPIAMVSLTDHAWAVAATADFNGDNRADILWRNIETGDNSIWLAGNIANSQAVSPVANPTWVIVAADDFDGDGRADILWRNLGNGANTIWRGGNSATALPVATVPVPWWIVAG